MKNIWKYLAGLVVIAIFVGYVWFSRQNPGASPETTPVATPATIPTTTASATTTGTVTTGNTGTTGAYKDGTYTGSAADAFYGTVQVAAVIKGGALTDVQMLQYPKDNGHSLQVSNASLPRLKQEAIAAQSANVNIVSGATQTSQAFKQSLAAALAQAKS